LPFATALVKRPCGVPCDVIDKPLGLRRVGL